MLMSSRLGGSRSAPSLSLILLCTFLTVLWLAGGASRADVTGQVVVRFVTAVLLAVAVLFGPRPALGGARAVAGLLAATVLLALFQLVPLPPVIWQALPGRTLLAQAAMLSGQPQPWRPWAIVPGATINAAASLIAPVAMLVFVSGLRPAERLWLPGLVLGMIAAATLVGVIQFSGVAIDNPLVNDTAGEVGGMFANRNHFALFLAWGCLLAPVWAFLGGRRPGWRAPVALGLVVLFTLLILGGGSRGGIIVGFLGLAIGLAITWRELRRALEQYPRWALPAAVAVLVALAACLVLLSVSAGRAVSLSRLLTSDVEQDMRSRGLPTVLTMIRTYFPAGSGLGSFDQLFRLHEPLALLKPTYFNPAHDDLLEIVLDAGLPGLLLLLAALFWWGRASLRTWRAGFGIGQALPKIGSAMLLLIVIASIFDYPARTPMMMAMIVLAGMWLGEQTEGRRGSALPKTDQHL